MTNAVQKLLKEDAWIEVVLQQCGRVLRRDVRRIPLRT